LAFAEYLEEIEERTGVRYGSGASTTHDIIFVFAQDKRYRWSNYL
jgi:hypothetical protein